MEATAQKKSTAVYTWYSDPGHAWLKVPRRTLEILGIADKISLFSYQSPGGQIAYLEEDCDAYTFIKAYEETYGVTLQFDEQVERTRSSRIRNLPAYR